MVRQAVRRRDQGRRSTDAQRDGRWHNPDQLRHGKPECCDGDGSAKCHCAEGRIVSRQMWRAEAQKSDWRLDLPIAAIRGEGTSNDYLPPEVPALPAFQLQRAVSTMIRDLGYDYWTGTVYTTNRRVWEHDDRFRDTLRRTRCMAIDMETATIFAAGFANHIPTGALLLVSDQPMIPEGVKTEASDQLVTANYVERHIRIGIEALKLVRRRGRSVKHLRFEDDFDAGHETGNEA